MGRFLNADAYASTGQGVLGNNSFAYCLNDPINCADIDGHKVIGIGVQVELQLGDVSVGVEFIWYFDPTVCGGNNGLIVRYVYSGYKFTYNGTTPVSFTSNGNTYYYITNLQGDVVAITNWHGRTVATYTYDAWGNPLSVNSYAIPGFAELNPLRYRGYIYDQETGLYYLQSRYYDPEMGRFLNADGYASTGQGILGNNMFAYCLNNPISMQDDDGYFGILTLCVAGAFVGGLIDYAGQVYENYSNGKTGADAWTDVNVGEIAGASFSGAISAVPGGAVWKDAADAIGSNIIEHGVNALIYGEEFDYVTVGREIVSDYAAAKILPDLLPMSNMPYFIRDIKDEARSVGVKGTRRLQTYLNISQISTIVINGFNSDTSDRLYEAVGLA